jgi:putative addiction module component (TIGR02574 family)
MATVQEILDAAKALPSAERAQLIHALWESVSPDDWMPPSDEWLAEAQRRSEAYDAGQMTAASWSEVRERARRKAGLDD